MMRRVVGKLFGRGSELHRRKAEFERKLRDECEQHKKYEAFLIAQIVKLEDEIALGK